MPQTLRLDPSACDCEFNKYLKNYAYMRSLIE